MLVKAFDAEFDIPDILINKFIKDFDGLPGSGQHESIVQLREAIHEVFNVVAGEPEILHEPEYLADFIRALAMQQALETHGILYDA
jgi:hypothetical protein